MSDLILRPCPFCGGKAKLVGDGRNGFKVWCLSNFCDAQVGWCAVKEDAIRNWNRRTKGE